MVTGRLVEHPCVRPRAPRAAPAHALSSRLLVDICPQQKTARPGSHREFLSCFIAGLAQSHVRQRCDARRQRLPRPQLGDARGALGRRQAPDQAAPAQVGPQTRAPGRDAREVQLPQRGHRRHDAARQPWRAREGAQAREAGAPLQVRGLPRVRLRQGLSARGPLRALRGALPGAVPKDHGRVDPAGAPARAAVGREAG